MANQALTGMDHSACNVIVLGQPRKPLQDVEISALHRYVGQGGALLVVSGGGGDKALGAAPTLGL